MAKYSLEIKDKSELEAKRKEVDEKADKKLDGDIVKVWAHFMNRPIREIPVSYTHLTLPTILRV